MSCLKTAILNALSLKVRSLLFSGFVWPKYSHFNAWFESDFEVVLCFAHNRQSNFLPVKFCQNFANATIS